MAYIDINDYKQYFSDEMGWTNAFKAAIQDLAVAGGGTLCVPPGIYHTCSIILKSNITLFLDAGSELHFMDDRYKYAQIKLEYIGAALTMFTPLIYAEGAENISVEGKGILNGHGERWWKAKTELRHNNLRRPHMICFYQCRRVKIDGVKLINSPAWTVHPLCCDDVLIHGISIKNPSESPNTDGINPNSSRNVRITGCVIDVGDDCIAIKSGTETASIHSPCENIIISDCNMVHGHGGIVIGSEMSGDIRNVVVSNCTFQNTDRGIRLKTRRKRGGVMEWMIFQNIIMENVISPFTVNMYYCCGANGMEKHVWDKTLYSKDETTPIIRNIQISNVMVNKAQGAAGFFYGLAESPIENISITDCFIHMDRQGPAGKPAMMQDMEDMLATGMFFRNIKNCILNNVSIQNNIGAELNTDETAEVNVL